jgi:hypothetical protein
MQHTNNNKFNLIIIIIYCFDGVRLRLCETEIANSPTAYPRLNMEQRWNHIDRGKPKDSEKKTCPSATLSTTNPTRTDLGAKRANPCTHSLTQLVLTLQSEAHLYYN